MAPLKYWTIIVDREDDDAGRPQIAFHARDLIAVDKSIQAIIFFMNPVHLMPGSTPDRDHIDAQTFACLSWIETCRKERKPNEDWVNEPHPFLLLRSDMPFEMVVFSSTPPEQIEGLNRALDWLYHDLSKVWPFWASWPLVDASTWHAGPVAES